MLLAVQVPSRYSPGGNSMHVVRPTDTLAGVALAYNMRVDELKRLNRLYGSSAIFPGQRLRVRANGNLKQCIDSMNTIATKSTNPSKDKFRNESADLGTSAGLKKKKRSAKNRHEDMLAPVDIIHAAERVAGAETETDSQKIGTDVTEGNKPSGIKGDDIAKRLSKTYKLFKKRINFKKNNVAAANKILEDGAAAPGPDMKNSIEKKNKPKIRKPKLKAKNERKSNELANLTKLTQTEVFKTRSQIVYHINEVYVHGEITIAMGNVSFEPDLDNCYVQKFGCALLTVSFALEDIVKFEEITDDMRMDYDRQKERLLCIELKPLESQLMMQTRASLEVLIPNDKFEQCLSLLRGATNTQKNNDSIDLAPPVSLTRSFMSPTALPILTQESDLISLENARKLARFFPNRHRCDDWVQLYTSTKFGFSWRTLHSKIKKAVPTILIFKDSNGYTFGAFVAHPWQKGPNFYGNGETFLFSLVPNFGVYKWTEKNSYFMTSSDSHFAFGGCEYGLYLDDELCNGCSYRSDTYFNRCLASEEEFQCIAVEAWTLHSK